MKNAPIPKRKYSKPPSSVAYALSLPFGIELDVKASPNAWWMDRELMEKLIQAFKIDATINEACAHAGISLRQYKYFTFLHPEFKEARRGLSLHPTLQAKLTIAKAIQAGNLKVSMWYLMKRLPDEFGSRRRKSKKSESVKIERVSSQERSPEVSAIVKRYEKELYITLIRPS